MADIQKYSEQTFESIKHINEYGQEFWYARELQAALEYSQWRRFEEAIERAKIACEQSGNPVADHFANVGLLGRQVAEGFVQRIVQLFGV